jgi:hypothetical protein
VTSSLVAGSPDPQTPASGLPVASSGHPATMLTLSQRIALTEKEATVRACDGGFERFKPL